MWLKNLFKREKRYKEMRKFEHIKLKCKNCNDIIEGDGKGTYISCTCGKIAVDEVRPYYTRIIGNEEDYERVDNKTIYEEALEKLKNNEKMWVNVKGIIEYKNYMISNYGELFDVGKNEIMPTFQLNKRSLQRGICLYENKTKRSYSVANLMSLSFEIPNEKNKKHIHHIDAVDNDRLDNLTFNRKENKERGIKEMIKKEYSDKDRIDSELINKQIKQQQDTEKEIWKWVVGYERWYEVSNKGNVRKINDDGSKKLLKASDVKSNYTRGRIVNLSKIGENQKVCQICRLVAEAFNIPNKNNSKTLYHIDGNINNDYLSNLTWNIEETEEYIDEQRKLKEEQERLEREKEGQNNKNILLNYIEENKEFLNQASEIKKEITIKDIYNKLCEILEVLKK